MKKNTVTKALIDSLCKRIEYKVTVVEGTNTTLAIAVLDGFTLAVGKSSCVDPANFSKTMGEMIARENALDESRELLWQLEGYVLHKALKESGDI